MSCLVSLHLNACSPDGVLDPELQSAGLSALQPGEQAGHAPLTALRLPLLLLLLLLGVLVHHGGPRHFNGGTGPEYSTAEVKRHGPEGGVMLAGQQRALLLLPPCPTLASRVSKSNTWSFSKPKPTHPPSKFWKNKTKKTKQKKQKKNKTKKRVKV